MLDDPIVEELPDTLRKVQGDVLPVLRTLADTHERVAFIAGSTERIMTLRRRDQPDVRRDPRRGACSAGRRPPTDRPPDQPPSSSASTAAGVAVGEELPDALGLGVLADPAAARPRACSARRKPRLGSCDHGTGP